MSSPQAKVFAVTSAIALVTELVGEIALYGLVPKENQVIKTRFWAQFVVGAALTLFMSGIGYVATDCLAKKGWTKTSWLVAIVPIMAGSTGFVIHGVDTVLGASSGSGSVALLKSAFASKKKKSTTK